MPNRRLLRFVTAFLLVWVAIDLAAIDTCALDVDRLSAPAHASVGPLARPGASTHPRAVLHPDHCFCHGLSIGADSSALLEPFRTDGAVPDAPPGHLLRVSFALYHPPQLPA